MHGKIHIEGNGREMLRAAFEKEQYRHAAELERKIIEKELIYFAEKNGHTLSGLTTFRAKCNEAERLNQIYKSYPDTLFKDIRAWQIIKDQLLFEGTRRVVPEKEFEEVAKEGERLVSALYKIHLTNS